MIVRTVLIRRNLCLKLLNVDKLKTVLFNTPKFYAEFDSVNNSYQWKSPFW